MSRRLTALLLTGAITALAAPAGASAANTLLWNALSSSSIGIASNAGAFDLFSGAGDNLVSPQGTTADPMSGKVFWANYDGGGSIYAGNLDGTGTPTLITNQNVSQATGLTFDPVGGKLYWANDDGDSIRYVKPDGTGAGTLYAQGTTPQMNDPLSPAVDPAHNRIYWANNGSGTIGYANLDGTGSAGTIALTGDCTPLTQTFSVAVDPAADKLYATGQTGPGASYGAIVANLNGSGCAALSAITFYAYGFAADPDTDTLFLAVTDADQVTTFSLASPSAATVLNTGTASTADANYPVVIGVPRGSATVAADGKALTCAASWSYGNPGMQFYRAPASATSYAWRRNGTTIAGATSATYTATGSGAYTCTTTASNFAGSGSGTSAEYIILPVTAKAPATLRRGMAGKLTVTVKNPSALAISKVKVCVKLPRGFKLTKKTGLKVTGTTACRTIASIAAGKSSTVTLNLKAPAKKGKGTYTISVQADGLTKLTKSAKTTVR